ncbi:pelota [Piptocephalis cylindrospora]|uniref:Protein DOM34 homolog n=1 Tax=Piptocephalis cylindrospora TaxID=1907219 RepID=A0A4P9Y3T1_9FUNG|nr:pelota [Piptocephalis cylindrospora]|eukprot:RKP13618.1 pelota [Piptocephalis cylindrospora]
MKLVKKQLEKDSSGFIVLVPEETEDMWHVYNLIQPGDHLKGSTIRRVQSESATGSTSSQRIHTTLTVSVLAVDFDTAGGILRISGKNMAENPYVKLGAHHTMELERGRSFTLTKASWDTIALERVDEACDVRKAADVAAIVLHEGLANVCLLTPSMTVVRQRIEVNIPRKRRGGESQQESVMRKFYDQCTQALLRHVDLSTTKVILLASPGFLREHLLAHIMAEAVRTNNRTLLDAKSKFLLVPCASGHKHALEQVLQDPTVASQLADTKAAREQQILDRFYHEMNVDPDKAPYGWEHVQKAHEMGAISILLVADSLFRSLNIGTRKQYVQLVEEVRAAGAQVAIFSTQHITGEQLSQMTGIAAITHFPVPNEEET